MSLYFKIYPENPQARLLQQACQLLAQGGVLAVPTDSSYALVCQLDDKSALDQLRRIRQLDEHQPLSILCRDLSELANYARVDNVQYRMLKAGTPGPFTFILQASREVPKRLSHSKRKTIGLRVPDHPVTLALLEQCGSALLASTLILPDDDEPLNDPQVMREQLDKQIAGIIDAGACPARASTIVDLSSGSPEVLRIGAGDPARLGL